MPQVSSDVTATPAQILRACLIDLDLVSFSQEQGQAWWCTVGSLPDSPDEAVCIKEGPGRFFGRRSRDKKNRINPGITIIIRAKRHDVGYTKANEIAKALDTELSPVDVTLPEENNEVVHSIQTVSRTSPVIHLGEEVGKQRELFSITAVIAFADAEPSLS